MDANKIIKQRFKIRPEDVSPLRAYGSSRENIYELFAELGFTYGAEVGVEKGYNAREMFRKIPNLKLLLVDPWVAYRKCSDENMESMYQRCFRILRRRDAVYLRKPSILAVREIPDNSLDFVYIDGMHDFDNIMTDIIQWSLKVKIGGIISGHDYAHWFNFGVIKAVDAYVYAHNIHAYYITGRVKGADEYPSFFWVKK